jgi:hypothetical protein
LVFPPSNPGVLSQSTSASRNPLPTRSSSSMVADARDFDFFAMAAILPGPARRRAT